VATVWISVCANSLVVPMEAADEAIPSAIEDVILNPAVVRRALDYALRALTAGSSDRRAVLEGS